jgi:SAM-dependent methyltransferase
MESLGILPGDFVVEVGGGHEPYERSDLILDKYPFDNIHRSQAMVYSAPTAIADAVRLPLPAHGCDWIFASHIIEHLPEPDRFLKEVQRCSKSVYLEFPGLNRELMFAWAFHEWLVIADGSHLVFYRNDIPQLFGRFFHQNYDFLLDAWAMQRHGELNGHVACDTSSLTWEFADIGAFEYAVGESATGSDKVNGAPETPVRYTTRQLAVLVAQRLLPDRILRRLVHGVRVRRAGEPTQLTQTLTDRLSCVRCDACELRLDSDRIVCSACGAEYGQRQGLFDFDILPDSLGPDA